MERLKRFERFNGFNRFNEFNRKRFNGLIRCAGFKGLMVKNTKRQTPNSKRQTPNTKQLM
jgi:hypothetical protein